MPPYSPSTSPAISAATPVTVWNAETPTPGTGAPASSQSVALRRLRDGSYKFAVDLQFSGAPGVFEVDVMVSYQDVLGTYSTPVGGVINTVDATNNTAHFDANANQGRFCKLMMRSRANNVTVTGIVYQ
jgi:hypothetical protein